MKELEILSALAITERASSGPWFVYHPKTLFHVKSKNGAYILEGNQEGVLTQANVEMIVAAADPSTGYAATLRALLEARELLRDCQEELPFGTQALADLNERVRAFLAEGESK